MRGSGSIGERILALLFLASLFGALALALFGRRMPAALAADAPPELFSAGRAQALLGRFALHRHPVGSGEHECVRETLLAELGALGLGYETHAGEVKGIPLTNVLVRIPGRASTGTILCLAHYDSVPTGPGASDDGAGTATWIEALRALVARGRQPRNDVELLLTDGEELGLLGARLFAADEHELEHLKVVVNLEAIGDGGPALLFELGDRNGARVREFARLIDAPAGTSLSDAVYRRMPNDTDLTVFLAKGIHGFNLALTMGSPAYHAAHDTPRNLDPRSLQHMGECALELVQGLGEHDLTNGLDADNVSFLDFLGRELVSWPRVFDIGPVVLGIGLLALARGRGFASWRELARALWSHARESGESAFPIVAAWWLLDTLAYCLAPGRGWVAGNTTSGALFFVGLVLMIVAHELRRADEPEERARVRGLNALSAWSVAALFALVCLPGASFAFAWPLVCAGLGFLATRSGRIGVGAALVLSLGLALTLFVALPILYLLLQLFLRRPSLAAFSIGSVLAAGTTLFLPQVRHLGRSLRASAGVLFTLGAGALVAALFVARVLDWRQGALWP